MIEFNLRNGTLPQVQVRLHGQPWFLYPVCGTTYTGPDCDGLYLELGGQNPVGVEVMASSLLHPGLQSGAGAPAEATCSVLVRCLPCTCAAPEEAMPT